MGLDKTPQHHQQQLLLRAQARSRSPNHEIVRRGSTSSSHSEVTIVKIDAGGKYSAAYSPARGIAPPDEISSPIAHSAAGAGGGASTNHTQSRRARRELRETEEDLSSAAVPSPFDSDHPRRCPKCMKEYKSVAGMRTHYLTHFPPTHRCRIDGCGRMFMTKYRRDRHEKTHSVERPFTCPVAACGATFKRQDSMRGHVRSVHMSLDRAAAATRPLRQRRRDSDPDTYTEFHPADFPELVAYMGKDPPPTPPEALVFGQSILQQRNDTTRVMTLPKIHSFAKKINVQLRRTGGIYYPPVEKASMGNLALATGDRGSGGHPPPISRSLAAHRQSGGDLPTPTPTPSRSLQAHRQSTRDATDAFLLSVASEKRTCGNNLLHPTAG